MTITASADGSALGNPGPAGWAWYVDDDCWGAGGWKHATNNVAELTAVLELFRATRGVDDDLLVMCDSQYVINSVTKWMPGWKAKGWRKSDGKPVMNLEVLKALDEELVGRRYRFEWVKGHVGHVLNEAADERARAAAEAFRAGKQVPAGPGWRGGDLSAVEPDFAVATPLDASDERVDTEVSLFDVEDFVAAPEWHTVTLTLSDEDHLRLKERARERGMSPEEYLRELI